MARAAVAALAVVAVVEAAAAAAGPDRGISDARERAIASKKNEWAVVGVFSGSRGCARTLL